VPWSTLYITDPEVLWRRQQPVAVRDLDFMSEVGHVWTAPPWQELSELLQHWSGAVMCPACLCGGEAAGHNALRGSGPNQKHAFKDALTQTGSPDPRIDLVCITSSCPRQFLQNFKRRRRCLVSPP
jgi:hypothetical protein